MTKYLLHGGESSRESIHNDYFFVQMTELVDKDNIKILFCLWARQPEKRQVVFEKQSNKIKSLTQKQISFSISEDQDDLYEKLEKADVLYVVGGDAEPIEKSFMQLKKLGEKLKNKIYVGSSMGAFLISQAYILSNDDQDSSPRKGLGLLSINMLCHWDNEPKREFKLKSLKEFSPDFPILTLDERKSVLIYR